MSGLNQGDILDGYRFLGGSPSDPRSWESTRIARGTVDSGFVYMGGDPADRSNWEEAGGAVRRGLGDTGIALLKGAIGVPEAVVGAADLVTGGYAGKGAEALGFRPKEAKAALDEMLSPQQRLANRNVQEAEGFFGTAKAALSNPSTILQTTLESAPSLLPAGAVARGALAVAPRLGGAVAAGIGEGLVSAGQTAEQVRQETADGLLTGEQAGIAGLSGALTGAIGGVAGKIANKLGIGDINQLVAGVKNAGPQAQKSLARALLEGFSTEGILQELPQSAQEQIAQNVALGRPWDEGVGNAAAVGALAGGVMGVAAAPRGHAARQPEAAKVPEGPTLQIANNPEPMVSFPDGKRSDIEAYVNGLPEDQRIEARARLLGMGPTLAEASTVSDMISAANELAFPTGEDLSALVPIPQPRELTTELGAQPAPAPAANGIDFEPTPTINTGALALEDMAPLTPAATAAALQAAEVLQLQRTPQEQIAEAPVDRAERRRSDAVTLPPVQPEAPADPVLTFVDSLRHVGTPQARAFVQDFNAGRITRRDVVRVMQQAGQDPLSADQRIQQAAEQAPAPAPAQAIEVPQTYRSRTAASMQARRSGGQVVPVSGGFQVKEAANAGPDVAGAGGPGPVDLGAGRGTGVLARDAGGTQHAGAPVRSADQGVVARDDGRGSDGALSAPIDSAANEAATSPVNKLAEPTEAQKAAGNYKLGHTRIAGLDISIENPQGSTRSGTDPDGKSWSNEMKSHYGYIKGTEGVDGDHVDVFVKPGTPADYSGQVYVVDQTDPKTGKHDEHKVLLGFDSEQAARDAYQENYAKGWTGLSAITPMSVDEFKAWVRDPAKTSQPLAVPAGDTGATRDSAAAPRVIGRVGRTPNAAAQVELRPNEDGTVTPHMEGEAMLDFDTGEPISLPADVTDADAKQAIREAGALSSSQNFYSAKAQEVRASRTVRTREAYEARIDALFEGGKPNITGARVLDRSDVLDMLGFGSGPVNLAENKVAAGRDNHPHMTEAVWKKIPDWLDNTAAVFDSDTQADRLVFIAPELVNGSPVRIIVEPNAKGASAHLLVNAYDAERNPFQRWERDGLLRYFDRQKATPVTGSFQPRLAGLPGERGRAKILTEKNLAAWRRSNEEASTAPDAAPVKDSEPKARRTPERSSGIPLERAQTYAQAYEDAGLNRVNVARNIDELPAKLRKKLSGFGDDVRGAYFPAEDQVWVFSDKVKSPEELHFVVMHEAFHRGLGATLGDDAKRVLRQMYATNKSLRDRADKVAAELKISKDEAIEEALADMAGEGDVGELRGWARLSKLIKDWLARIGGAVGINREFTDDEVQSFVSAMARSGVSVDPAVQAEADAEPEPGTKSEAAPKASRPVELPDWVKDGPEALQSAAGKVDTFRPQATFKEKVDGFRQDWKKRLVQGLFDSYAPLKDLDYDAYVAARMAKSGDGVLEGMLMYGRPKMDASGAISGELDGKGFLGAMQELQGEHDRFFMWLAGNRARRLKVEGRENLFSDDEISAMSKLNGGEMADGKSRAEAYRAAANTLQAYNKSVLDVAQQAGIIDGESRATWEHDFYVPFFRLNEDDTTAGPGRVKGLVRQKGIEKLKGGKEPLGDLMENTLRNWSQLINASLANEAAKKSLQAAERAGVALEATEDATKEMAKSLGKKGSAVYYMDDGRQRWFIVDDPFVLDAISSMESVQMNGLPLKVMGAFKKWLTFGVTVAPAFKVRNLIRDSVSAIAQSNLDYRIDRNLAQGWKATDTKSADYAQMLFGGGLMRFGTQLEGNRAAHVKRLIQDGVKDDTILNTPEKVKAAARKARDAYNGFGDRLENINRAALYKQLIEQGKTLQQAAFEARDLMDFGLQGSFTAVRFLTQVVPFMNARLQGLYKLGRSASENPRRFGYVAGAVALASIALMLANQDDDDWKRREDWDRDNFWWFKIGNTAYRIPKPFEVGAIGTIAERSVELLINDEMDGKRYAQRLRQMVGDTFAMNPVPQFFKPLLDLYANKDSFTGREIETQGMERHSKPERYGPSTSSLAMLLGQAGNYTNLSPVQVDQLLRGYFGWLGSTLPGFVDAVRPGSGRPAERIDEWSGGFIKSLPAGQSRYATAFWEEAKSLEQFSADLKRAREIGDFEKARELVEENRDKLGLVKVYRHAQEQMERINKQVRFVRDSQALSPQEKRERLDQLAEIKNRLAEAIETRRSRMSQ